MKRILSLMLALACVCGIAGSAHARLVTKPVPFQFTRLVNGFPVVSDSSTVGAPWGVTLQTTDTSAVVDLSQAMFNSGVQTTTADSSLAFRFILACPTDPNGVTANCDSLAATIQSSLDGVTWQIFQADTKLDISSATAPYNVSWTFNNILVTGLASGLNGVLNPKIIAGKVRAGLPLVRFIRRLNGNNGASDQAVRFQLFVQYFAPDNATDRPTQ